jgi:glutamate/tyrosine decarboxylase-like PLP-dependent enzyme
VAKAKIDLDPKGEITYEREVSIPTPSGKALKVSFTFKQRTREKMAELLDTYIAKARESAKQELPEDAKMVDQVEQSIASDVSAILDVATDWNVDGYQFTAENLTKFLRLYPGAAMAIVTDYRISQTEGRLGN